MERDAKDYADSIHAIFVETSAKNAININELFIEISEYLHAVWVSPVQDNIKVTWLGRVLPGAGWSGLRHRSQWKGVEREERQPLSM